MGNTNIYWVQLSDSAIVTQIGNFVKKNRLRQNITQAKLAEMAGLNRWTISQLENGESVNLASLIQILRALDVLYVLSQFEFIDEISPLEYAKLKKKEKERARSKNSKETDQEDLGW
ncbi:MAG: helix-turn-helix domain-containing protein [Prolixibacteraceae bacterium]|jgi:transcriptional regulator with XRE-family HTH domain|nr:helix-turn-helix domain-containing protein [Prolixibacteraceae bacterium]